MSNVSEHGSLITRCIDLEYLRARVPQLNEADRALVRDYLICIAHRNYAPGTLYQFIADCAAFRRWVPDTDWRSVTVRDIEQFIERQQDQKLHPATINNRLSALSAFYHYLRDQNQVRRNPILRRHYLQMPDRLPRAMSAADYQRFLRVITKPRDRAMFLLLLRSGIRLGELIAARRDQLRLAEQELTIPLGRKNRRGRIVYFSADARQALEDYLKQRPDGPSSALFLNPQLEALSMRRVQYIFSGYIQKAGLPAHYTCHCLRHTFATELLNAGADLVTIQYLLGHDHIQITQRYARLADPIKRRSYFEAMTRITAAAQEVPDVV